MCFAKPWKTEKMKAQIILKEGKSAEETSEVYSVHLCNWCGLVVSLGLISFFLLMKGLNLHEILALRYLNFLFLFAGIIFVLYQYQKKNATKGVDYFTGLKMGIRISLLAVIPFAIFMGIYLVVDENFMNYIKHTADFGNYLTPGLAAGSILVEGVSSGVIITYMSMQYFKEK